MGYLASRKPSSLIVACIIARGRSWMRWYTKIGVHIPCVSLHRTAWFSGRRRRARPGRPPRSWRRRGGCPHWPGRARQRCGPRTCARTGGSHQRGRESVGGGVAGFALRVERLKESLAGRLACLREVSAQMACLVYLIDPRGRALLCDELETGPPVVVIAAAYSAPAPCQPMLWRETEPTKRQSWRPEGTHRHRCQSTWPRRRR